jgi:hypothetical protein
MRLSGVSRSVGLGVVVASLLTLALAGPASTQTNLDVKTSPPPGDPRELEIVAPSPGAREVNRPREADFYREDIRVRHEPGFVEPLTARPASGPIKKVGLSGWTAPPGRGDGVAQHETSGWFGFGLSIIWE